MCNSVQKQPAKYDVKVAKIYTHTHTHTHTHLNSAEKKFFININGGKNV